MSITNKVISINKIDFSISQIVGFVISHGIRINKEDRLEYVMFMLEYHATIEFYGIKYFIPLKKNYSDVDIEIYEYIKNKYSTNRLNVVNLFY